METRQKKIEGLLENIVDLVLSSNGGLQMNVLPQEFKNASCSFLRQPIRSKEELLELEEVLKNVDETEKNQLVLSRYKHKYILKIYVCYCTLDF